MFRNAFAHRHVRLGPLFYSIQIYLVLQDGLDDSLTSSVGFQMAELPEI